MTLQWAGPVLAVFTIATIAFGHTAVRKVNYLYGTKPAPCVFAVGLVILFLSLHVTADLVSALIYLGLGLAGGSWLIAAFAICFFTGYQWTATLEERLCKQHWPEEFAEYKRKVAKNFLFF